MSLSFSPQSNTVNRFFRVCDDCCAVALGPLRFQKTKILTISQKKSMNLVNVVA